MRKSCEPVSYKHVLCLVRNIVALGTGMNNLNLSIALCTWARHFTIILSITVSLFTV